MKKGRDAGLTFGLGLLLLFGVPIGLAQQRGANYLGKWMLEIVQANQEPEYLRMPEGHDEDHADEYGINLRFSNHPSHNQFSDLEFHYWMEGAAARVLVSLMSDSSNGRPGSEKEVPVGNYIIQPGESVTVSQLSQFGLQPVQVKMVTAKLPDAIKPEIVNETSSMVVENLDQNRAEYKLFLRNRSELTAHALVVSVIDGDGRCWMHDLSIGYGPLMAPGETDKFDLIFLHGVEGEVGADGMSCSYTPQSAGGATQRANSSGTRAPKIVIEAVDFKDGSYDGNAQKAAMMEAQRLGRKIERTRITAIVESQLENGQPDGMAKLTSVQSQVKALIDSVDLAALNSIMARFTAVPASAKESIERDIHEGMLMEKGMVLGNLRIYLFELSKGLTLGPSLELWWDATKGRHDFL